MTSVLDNNVRAQIRVRYAAGGVSQTQLAHEYRVSPSFMCKVINGRDLQRPEVAARAAANTRYESLDRLYQRRNQLWEKYRMTLDDYAALLAKQGGVCAICHTEPPDSSSLHVDHDHRCCHDRPTCGRCTRGLLCGGCNRLLGWLEKVGPEALAYLREYGWEVVASGSAAYYD